MSYGTDFWDTATKPRPRATVPSTPTVTQTRPPGFIGPVPISKPEQQTFRVATLPPWMGGGAYNIGPDVNKIVKTPRVSTGETSQAGTQLDHIVSVGLGGASVPQNIRKEPLLPKNQQSTYVHTPTDKLEADLAAKVKAGKITLGGARLELITAKQQQTQPLKTTTGQNFWESLGHVVETPVRKLAGVVVKVLEGPTERTLAVGESVKQKSLDPLKQSFVAQEKSLVIQPGDSKEVQIKKATNLALMLGVDSGLNAGKPKASSSEIPPKPLQGEKPLQTFPKTSPQDVPASLPLQSKSLKPEQKLPAGSQELQTSAQKILSEPVSSRPIVGQDFYNVNKLNINPETKVAVTSEIKNAKQQIESVVGSKLSNKEALAIADETSAVLNKTVTRAETEAKIAANLKLRQQIAYTAETGQIDGSFIDLWIKDKAASTDIARQLQARKIVADPQEVSSINLLLEAIYKQNKNAEEIIAAAKNVDFNDPHQVVGFYRQFVKPKASEWLDLLRYNSMLSSPTTHIVNTASNFEGTGIIAPIEKTITGALDATRVALTGGERRYFAGEGVQYAKGYYSNVKKASQTFWDVMRGRELNKNPDIRNIPLATGGKLAKVEKTLGFPIKLLEAADRFFTTLTEGGTQQSLEYRVSKGVKVGNLNKVATAEAQKRLFRSGGNLPEQGHVLNAIDTVTNTLMQLRSSDNPIVSTISKFTLPFVRTPMNLFKQGIEYSPLGITTLVGASNKTEQLSKVIIGTASAAAAATLLGTDRLTWAEPTDPDSKAQFRASGRQPYSVKIGDHWVSYAKLHPAFAFNFALVAAVDNGIKNRKLDESQAHAILTSFAKYGQFVADQSYLKNIGDFVATTKGDLEGPARYWANYPQQVIPFRALLGWVERLTDPVQRKVDSTKGVLDKQMKQIMAQIPVLAQKVPARLGPDGVPVPNQNRLVNAVSPARVTTETKFSSLKTKEDIKSTYNQVQDLVKQGKQSEAEKLVDGLSDTDYTAYKKVKQAAKSAATKVAETNMIPTVKKVQDLVKQGKEGEARAIIDQMSDEDYRVYGLTKKKLGIK